MYQGMEDKIKATEVYIKPDITGYSVITFDKGIEIIQTGVAAAAKKLPELQKLGSDFLISKLPIYIINDEVLIHSVKMNELKNYNKHCIFGKLGNMAHACVSFNRLKEGITNLNA